MWYNMFYLYDFWTFFWCRKEVNQCMFWLCLLKQMTQAHNNSVYSLWLFCIQVCNNTSDRKHADTTLESYVTETVMSIVTTFFSSPFSDQSTSLQVMTPIQQHILLIYLQMLSMCCFQFQFNFGSPPFASSVHTAVWFLWS